MENNWFSIDVLPGVESLFCYKPKKGGEAILITAPSIEIDGQLVTLHPTQLTLSERIPSTIPGVVDYYYQGTVAVDFQLILHLVFRLANDSPVLRYRFEISALEPRELTRSNDADRLDYWTTQVPADAEITEITLGEFDRLAHTYRPFERKVALKDREAGMKRMGPILASTNHEGTQVFAYEHGSQAPDGFLAYSFHSPDQVTLKAVKGNYWNKYRLSKELSFSSIWSSLLSIPGGIEDAAHHFRSYLLHHQSPNSSSRKPFIFYNTWNNQERNQAWHRKKYLDSMNEERMLAEIDVAHALGIDVFVIDTGWYQKTGDWTTSSVRFPRGLQPIRERLDQYQMKLGLWFSPTEAAITSRAVREFGDCILTKNGETSEPRQVWETEESYGMCLVSRYWEAFADELIRCHKELGVTYFKWDAIGQYGCDDPHHEHGTEENTIQERSDAYAFRQVLYMGKIVDRLCAACPDAIVDFDVTEAGRSMGLAFLASGKYFLINNGPYFSSFDFPHYDVRSLISKEKIPTDHRVDTNIRKFDFGMGANVLVYPGTARAQNCRVSLTYDKWIPSVLFLTHYLPDDPIASQAVNLASLMLGHNGIWGDLQSISDTGVTFIRRILDGYKVVREAITKSSLVRIGEPGASPEIYEKIDNQSGEGLICAFSTSATKFEYIPQTNQLSDVLVAHNASYSILEASLSRVTFEFKERGAAFILFGKTKKNIEEKQV